MAIDPNGSIVSRRALPHPRFSIAYAVCPVPTSLAGVEQGQGIRGNRFQRFWRKLGPGLITGASDDDPSGIATYSQAGAAFGTGQLWTLVLTYPLMVSVQEMCARIGLVTGKGLMGVITDHYPRWLVRLVLWVAAPAIVLNIGANIAAMGAVGNLLVPGVPDYMFSAVFTVLLLYATILWSYRRIARVLKWLCLALFAYLFIPFLTGTDWSTALKRTFIPVLRDEPAYWMMLVAVLGTTISPYLFFWQANMEVEERQRRGVLVVDRRMLGAMRIDVRTGMFMSNVVAWAIMLACGTVLFNAGLHDIATVKDAAEALRPLAGDMAHLLFALGVLGTGFLALPVLAGALSYMMAEAYDWPEGLDKRFNEAPAFYATLIVALLMGLFIDLAPISPVQALIWTAVLYGFTAPVLIGIILFICNDRRVMGEHVNSRRQNALGVVTLLLMSAAAIGLVWNLLA
ncbi:MAG: divalent metal cation transporter [Flavobacteriales bacterium]|nr:divalent metal cation transporter [Flavobacteriales bacterium]